MSEKELIGRIQISYGINLPQAIIRSLGVILSLGLLVILGDLLSLAGNNVPVVILLLTGLVLLNCLGYIELSVSSPRKGGAYHLVQGNEEGNWLAFLTGWTLILGGITASGVLVKSFAGQVSNLFFTLFSVKIPVYYLAIGLLVLVFIIRLFPKIRNFRRNLLIFLIGLILIIIIVAVPAIEIKHLLPIKGDWRLTFTFLLLSFYGLEIASGLQGDLRHHSKNTPKLFLITIGFSGLVFSLVSLISLGVGIQGAASTNILAHLGQVFNKTWISTGLILLSLIIFPIVLNRVLSSVIRQIFVMTNDGYWPKQLLKIDQRSRTPLLIGIITIVATGVSILAPITYLIKLGSFFYLVLLIAVNITLVRHEQIKSSFQLPIHPWVPAIAVIIDLLIIFAWAEVLPAAALLLFGGVVTFLFYGRHHIIKAKEGITVFKSEPVEDKAKQHTRILVPIANPDTVESLLHLAGSLVRHEGGKVIALRVITVPNQLPLSEGSIQAEADRLLLDQACNQATEEEFRIETITRVSRSIAEGILDTAREEDVDQILVGWSGGSNRSLTRSMGPVLDPIIKDAPCDVLVVKGFDWQNINSILVPTAGGPNAPLGAKLAQKLAMNSGAQVTGLYVQVGRASSSRMAENQRILGKTFNELDFPHPPDLKVQIANSIVSGILKEAENHDLVIVGASEQGFIDQFTFGSIPQQIASQAQNNSVMVKGYTGAPDFLVRKIIRTIFNLFPNLTTEEQLEVREELTDDAEPGRDYFVLIALSSIIATLGLLLNSPAVVIGAMLVAPLMSPILGFSLGIVLGEIRLVRTSLESVFKGVAATIIVSILVGLISPLKELTPEILSRTQPTLLDLFIALASGMAGAYALSRKDVSAALPGVAIAAALAPPLSAVGLGFALGDLSVAGGAFLLFITNLITISLAGVIIFSLLGIHPLNLQPEIKRRVRRGITGIVFLVVLITIPLGVLMTGIIRQNQEFQQVEKYLMESPILEDSTLIDLERSRMDDHLIITATIRSSEPITENQVNILAQDLESELGQSLLLEVITLPVTRSE